MIPLRNILLVVVALGLVILAMSVFTVRAGQDAIRFRFGAVQQAGYEPGLHFKFPLINNVRVFDARIQTLDTTPERFLTAEKKNLLVDSFVKWRISDVQRYFERLRGDPNRANIRLDQIIKDGLRAEFSKRTVQEVVSGERSQIMDVISEVAKEESEKLGIEVVGVRIKRVELPAEVSNSVYRRMRAERERIAREFRSRGAEQAESIQANADRQRTVILANAFRDAETLRGEGDALAANTYANAYNQNPEFYSLYRSLSAYRNSFQDNEGMIVLKPDSEFFRYFKAIPQQVLQAESPPPAETQSAAPAVVAGGDAQASAPPPLAAPQAVTVAPSGGNSSQSQADGATPSAENLAQRQDSANPGAPQ
ncbi:MAG: protease modulator HflC [Candidatus Competibacterales bacterium]